MKTFKQLTLAAVLSLSAFTATVRAEIQTVLNVTATALIQRDSTDNGTNTITPSPAVRTFTTKTILKQLALDKFILGDYPATNFPAGAKLVMIFSGEGATFQVVSRTNEFLVDVSDIFHLEVGERQVFSGKVNDDTSLPNPSVTERRMVSLEFDDTEITGGGDVKFVLIGLMKSVTTDTKPSVTTGRYVETQNHSVTQASGHGAYLGADAVITGSFNAIGSAVLEAF
ncbi:MAG: hypothetical protein U1F65_08650 [Verrucomicrobiota bacterium]